MDLNKVTDLKELKAMVYDQLMVKQVADQNLAALNARIAELQVEKPAEDKTEDPK